jgi:type I restriction enzyme S subunit
VSLTNSRISETPGTFNVVEHRANENWRVCSIGDTGKYVNGVAFKPSDWGEEGLPIIRIQNLTEPGRKMNRTTRKVDPMYLVEPGDLLVSWSATLDAFIWDREPALLNQHIFKVVPNTDLVSKKFLFHSLRLAISEMLKSEHLHGSTMKHINRGPFLAHGISVPSLAKQSEIVAELEMQFSRLDEAVASLKRVKANLNRYKAAVLTAAIAARLVPTEAEIANREGRTYEPGDQLLLRILSARRADSVARRTYVEPANPIEAEFSALPEGWTVGSLESLTNANRVICYGILMPKDNVNDGVLYVKVRDMKGDVIDISGLQRTSPAIAMKYARSSLKAGDLLLAIRGTFGRVATVPMELEAGNITQDTARLALSPLMEREFVASYLRSDTAQRYFKRVARGVAVKGVNIGDIRPMAVPIPPRAEQRRIVDEIERRMSFIREIEGEVEGNLQRSLGLRRSILHSQFNTPSRDSD